MILPQHESAVARYSRVTGASCRALAAFFRRLVNSPCVSASWLVHFPSDIFAYPGRSVELD